MSDKLTVGRINFGPSSCPHGVWPTFPCKECGGVVPHDSKIPRQERIDALQRQLADAWAENEQLREALKQQPCICTPGGNGCIRCAALSGGRDQGGDV